MQAILCCSLVKKNAAVFLRSSKNLKYFDHAVKFLKNKNDEHKRNEIKITDNN